MRAIALALAASAFALAACGGGEVPAIGANDRVLGEPDAPVEIVEYASASCAHCARFAEEVFPELKAKYIDTGKARYAMREVVGAGDAYGQAGFLLARCVDEDRYYPVMEAIFRGQRSLQTTGDVRGVLVQIAQSAGLNEQEFMACVTDEQNVRALQNRNERNFADYGGQGTPTFYFNGEQPFPAGELTMAEIDEAMEKALAE